MANRQQRRLSQRDPRVRALSKRFAEEFSAMTLQLFEPILDAERRGERVDFQVDEVTRKLFEAKGEELGRELQKLMSEFATGATQGVRQGGPKVKIQGRPE